MAEKRKREEEEDEWEPPTAPPPAKSLRPREEQALSPAPRRPPISSGEFDLAPLPLLFYTSRSSEANSHVYVLKNGEHKVVFRAATVGVKERVDIGVKGLLCKKHKMPFEA